MACQALENICVGERQPPKRNMSEETDTVLCQGTVKWFNRRAGYGFIAPEDGGEDLFVHHTGLSGTRSLRERNRVKYAVEVDAADASKSKAVQVKRLRPPKPSGAKAKGSTEPAKLDKPYRRPRRRVRSGAKKPSGKDVDGDEGKLDKTEPIEVN